MCDLDPFSKIRSQIILEMAEGLAQGLSGSVITDFTRLEYCTQDGAIRKVSKHFT